MPAQDAATWKTLFISRLRSLLPQSLLTDLETLSQTVWECAAKVPPEEAADIASRYIAEEEAATPWFIQ